MREGASTKDTFDLDGSSQWNQKKTPAPQSPLSNLKEVSWSMLRLLIIRMSTIQTHTHCSNNNKHFRRIIVRNSSSPCSPFICSNSAHLLISSDLRLSGCCTSEYFPVPGTCTKYVLPGMVITSMTIDDTCW